MKLYIKLLFILCVCSVFVGCSKDDEQTERSGFVISLDEATVDVASRATPKELGKPLDVNFHIKVVNTTTGSSVYDGAFTKLIPVNAGSYELTASYGEDVELEFDTPYYIGTVTAEHQKKLDTMDGNAKVNDKYLQTSYKLTPVRDPYASKVDLRETVDGWFVPTMPDLNQRNPHVMKYLIQNSEWWIETVGIDGIRMDTYPYADRDGMALWMKTLDKEYPNFNTVGETWVTEPAYTAAWQKDSKLSDKNSYLKTVMDFAFFDRINQAKHEETDDWWNGMNRIYNVLCYDYLYPNPKSVMAFVENHDTDRFLGEGKDTLALKQALALLLTINRTPQLYYGTEVLMNGTKSVTDGNVRKDFPGGWADDKQNAFTAEGRTKAQNDMFRWTSRLLHWRQSNEVITKGTQTQFCSHKGIYVVARQYKGKSVMTVINGKNNAAELDVKRYAEIIGDAQNAVDVTTGRNVIISHNVKLRPRQTMVLEF